MLLFLVSIAAAYGIDRQNGGVTYSNAWGNLSAYPEVLHDMQGDVYVNITSNFTTAQQIDIAFSFDTSKARPIDAAIMANAPHQVPVFGNTLRSVYCGNSSYGIVDSNQVWCANATANTTLWCPSPRTFTTNPTNATCYFNQSNTVVDWNTQYWNDWVSVSNLASVIQNGPVKTYYFTGVNFNPGETKQGRFTFFASPNTVTKYNITMKLTSDSMQDALASGRYVDIDPVINASQNICDQILYSCPGNGCQNKSIMTMLITNATMLNQMGVGGKSIRVYFNVSAVDYPTNFTILNWTAGLNASLFIRFINGTNGTTAAGVNYWLCYNDTGGAANSVSNPYTTFDVFNNLTYQDVTNWTDYTNGGYYNGAWGEYSYSGAKYGIYRNYIAAAPLTMFYEAASAASMQVYLSCGDWNGGNGYWGWYIQDAGSGGYNANYLSERDTGTNLNLKAMTTSNTHTYLYRMVWNDTWNMNISRMNTSASYIYGKGRLEGNRWYSIYQWNATTTVADVMPVYAGVATPQNMSLLWVGIINASQNPEFTGFGNHVTGSANTPPNAYNITWCNGTACTFLNTVYKGTIVGLNASGNCSDGEDALLTGYWNYTINGTQAPWYFNIRYLWRNQWTNYTNGSKIVLNAVMNKSDTWGINLTCYDGTINGTLNSTNNTFTVNNTACVLGVPNISPVTGNLANNSTVLTCNNGTYTDADSDAQVKWGYYTWYKNNVLIAGQTGQTIALWNISGGVPGASWFNCSWTTGDVSTVGLAYNTTCSSLPSINVTVNAPPTVTIQSPAEGYAFNGTNILTTSFIAVDDNASVMNCSLYSNATAGGGILNVSNAVQNNTLTWLNFTVAGDLHSRLWVNITCWDGNLVGNSSATNYSRWECWNVSFATTLNENVDIDKSCFQLLRNNTDFNCNGYNITNTAGNIGVGIYATDANNLTTRNCLIRDFKYGIFYNNTNFTDIYSNTILQNINVPGAGITLRSDTGKSSINNSITFNNIFANSSNQEFGIYLITNGVGSNQTNITNNNVSINGTSSSYGIVVGNGLVSYYENVSNNRLYINTTSNPAGIYVSTLANSTFTNNTIYIYSNLGTEGYGILIQGAESDSNNFTYNQILAGNWSLYVNALNADLNSFILNNFSARQNYGGYAFDNSGDNTYNNTYYGNWWGDILSTNICDSNPIDGIGDKFTPYNNTNGNVTTFVVDYHPFTTNQCGSIGGGGNSLGNQTPALTNVTAPTNVTKEVCSEYDGWRKYQCRLDIWIRGNTDLGQYGGIPDWGIGWVSGLLFILMDIEFGYLFVAKDKKGDIKVGWITALAAFWGMYVTGVMWGVYAGLLIAVLVVAFDLELERQNAKKRKEEKSVLGLTRLSVPAAVWIIYSLVLAALPYINVPGLYP